jgi:ferredoxin
VKLRVDGTACQGHGRCYMLAPDLLECDDEGFVTIRDDEIAIPAGLEGLAADLAGSCPESAISLTDA